MKKINKMEAAEAKVFLEMLESRFLKNRIRHNDVKWSDVYDRLKSNATALWTLHEMERTGGEPDVVQLETETGSLFFVDCSAESPAGRRSLCYDKAGLDSRKEHKPLHAAIELAAEMGVELMDESQYRQLQQLGAFDLKTSSWLKTPEAIRKLGGALFGDRRYDTTFVYHNGAQSYYAARGFRGVLEI
jgi:hypothetical protein